MKNRKTVSLALLTIAVLICIDFLLKIEFPQGFGAYFKRAYYNQFGPFAIGLELVIASYYLLVGHEKTNFALALFGFTALLDPLFDQLGLFESRVPLYEAIILSICAMFCLWIAFKNVFNLKRISFLTAFSSFILGILIEMFFNYL